MPHLGPAPTERWVPRGRGAGGWRRVGASCGRAPYRVSQKGLLGVCQPEIAHDYAPFYSGTYEPRVPALSVRSFKAACGFPEDGQGRSPNFCSPGLRVTGTAGKERNSMTVSCLYCG
jgi:hypothetical protein